MDYQNLNVFNRGKMRGACNSGEHFEWEDSDFMSLMKGKLCCPRNYSNNLEVQKLYSQLERICNDYDFFETNKAFLVNEIRRLVSEIRNYEPYWARIDASDIEEMMKKHKSCLISGEGGIGKSYFIKCLEEELAIQKTKHLCVYGKFTKDIADIDFEAIRRIGTHEAFVFAFDAINEISKEQQLMLAEELEKIKNVRGLRIIITYRSHTMDENILCQYQKLAESAYRFPGVSFESVLEWLQKTPVRDINEYIDILYSNNPFLLSKLPLIFENQQHRPRANNISRVTHIYEQYIQRSIDRETWNKTKLVAQILYDNNKKLFTIEDIEHKVSNPQRYVYEMKQSALIDEVITEGGVQYSFVIDSLSDFLIVRYMGKELTGKTTDECIEIISNKVNNFWNLSRETVILMLFDKFSPDFMKIRQIMNATQLMDSFSYDTLLKVHFEPEMIDQFLSVFQPANSSELIIYFAGYLNKPFNCTHFLNQYYLEDMVRQQTELSPRLAGDYYFFAGLKGRLKNILYATCKCACEKSRAIENLYTAIWCSSACDWEIRSLSMKLLYETIERNFEFSQTVMDLFARISDDYIREAIIHALSSCRFDKRIAAFFNSLLDDPDFICAKSLRRMSCYVGKKYQYIDLEKRNLLLDGDVSEEFIRMLYNVDVMEKNLLPFRIFGMDRVESSTRFLFIEKSEIRKFNDEICSKFECVKNGDCKGRLDFQKKVEQLMEVSYQTKNITMNQLLSTLEYTLGEVLKKYGLSCEYEKALGRFDTFSRSVFKKCICIAVDIVWGSLMCNYYVDEFSTYNNLQDSIGYEVYDPIAYEEQLNLTSPLCLYQPKVEYMGDIILSRVDLPAMKDETWWSNLEITKSNIRAILQPFFYDGYEWCLLSCHITLKDDVNVAQWIDSYDVFVCCSEEETLKGDGNERYLTIETKEYEKSLLDYESCVQHPWLCKSVPSIMYNSNTFEETKLLLPPAILIKTLGLTLDLSRMCWVNSQKEPIIVCNNNRASYFRDPINGTAFIRKDFYEEVKKRLPIKFFAFSERYIKGRGYCEETDYHFEIIDDSIVKAVNNHQGCGTVHDNMLPVQCAQCKYGFCETSDKTDGAKITLEDIIIEYGI